MSRHHHSRFERPHSEQLVDLHIYVVPQDLWQDRLNSALNQIVDDTVSAGFVRVLPETTIFGLREEIGRQLGADVIPQDYVFLKSVGRCLTRVKAKQEHQMKVKHFLPPHAYSPEIFLLEPTPQMRGLISSDDESLRNSSYNSSPGRSIGGRRAIEQEPGARDHYYNRGKHQGQNGDIAVWDRRKPAIEEHSLESQDSQKATSRQSQRGYSDIRHYRQTLQDSRRKSESQPYQADNQNVLTDASRNQIDNRTYRADHILPPIGKEGYAIDGSQGRSYNEQDPLADGAAGNTQELNDGGGQNGGGGEEFLRRKQQEEEEKLHQEEEARRRAEEAWRKEEEARRAEEARIRAAEAARAEEERRRQEEEQRRQEEERRRREEEERRLEEERRRKDFPSPPPLTVTSYLEPAEEKKQILAELEETRQRRREIEARREDLVRKAKQLQAKTQSRRNQARDMWKKKYFEEKKKTPPLEDKCNRLRQELELLHRKIVGQMEGGKGREMFKIEKGDNRPSHQNNLRIQATKLHHEIEELQRRVDDAKMKLTGEVKLRNQAEAELRALRAELTQKKINVTLTRSQKLAALGSSQDVYTPRAAAVSPRS